MPILEDDVLWAKNLQFDNTTGRPNREEIPLELLYSGLLRNQALPRPFINQILYQQGQATLTVQSDYIAADTILQSNIDAEALARSNADDGLQSNLDTEISNRISADDLLQSNLDTEISNRTSADNDLQSQINSLTQAILQQIMPVGYLYVTKNTTSPASQLGFGDWSLIEGKTLVGIDSEDSDFDTIGKEGGFKEHNHSASSSTTTDVTIDNHVLTVDEIPSHSHIQKGSEDGGSTFGYQMDTNNVAGNFPLTTVSTEETGGGEGHNHSASATSTTTTTIGDDSSLQPYHVVYIWERTA